MPSFECEPNTVAVVGGALAKGVISVICPGTLKAVSFDATF